MTGLKLHCFPEADPAEGEKSEGEKMATAMGMTTERAVRSHTYGPARIPARTL